VSYCAGAHCKCRAFPKAGACRNVKPITAGRQGHRLLENGGVHENRLVKRESFAVSYASAEQAWFDGQYRTAIDVLRAANTVTKLQSVDRSLLMARALLRIGESREALSFAHAAVGGPCGADRKATALMLQGAALTKLGLFNDAAEKLKDGRSVKAVHRTIVAENSLQTALLAYVQRTPTDERWLVECRSWAVNAVAKAQDIVLARAQELLGFVNVAEEKYGDALKSFRQALATLAASQHRDQLLEANIVHVLTSLSFERLEVQALEPSLLSLSRLQWNEDISKSQFQVLQNVGWLALVAGEPELAWGHLMSARDAAAGDAAYTIMSLVNLASLHRYVNDHAASCWFLKSASRMISEVEWTSLDADHRAAFVEWVTEAARQGVPVSMATIDAFEDLPQSGGDKSFARGDRRFQALQLTARGLAFRERNVPRALKMLRRALDIWLEVGYRFRATTTALDLYRLTDDVQYLKVAQGETRSIRRGWLHDQVMDEIRKANRGFADLSSAERRVLDQMLAGKSAATIARNSARAEQTIKNQTRAIFEKLGVKTRAELFALCARFDIKRVG